MIDLNVAPGDTVTIPPGQGVLPGQYVVTKVERKDRGDHTAEMNLTLQDVRFAGGDWFYSPILD